MALPTLEKTWQFNVNQVSATGGSNLADCANTIYKLKAAMTGFSSNPWTVVRSSNSVTAGAADYWASSANLVWNGGGSAHSWIVLQQAGITGGPMQFLIDCDGQGTTPSLFRGMVSVSGFTGGTTTARPTATDEVLLIRNDNTSLPNVAMNQILHVMQSTDGQCTRAFVFGSGSRYLLLSFESLADSTLTYKGAAMGKYYSQATSELYSNANWVCKNSSTVCYCYTATEVYNNVQVANANNGAPSNIANAYPLAPLSLHSETASYRGRYGRVSDMWFGSSSIPTGATYPSSPDDREFLQVGNLVLPWNGTIPIIT